MIPTFFANQEEFRNWLQQNHKTQTELIVGFYKVGTGKPSMTWSESVDQAICFGWIDGVRRSVDSESYSIRFTPRKPNSIWSAINIKKAEDLTKLGLMMPAGTKAFGLRTDKNSKIYSHENDAMTLETVYEEEFKTNLAAWEFFNSQPPSYKKFTIHWIMSAKQEKTRLSRLRKTISASEEKNRV